MLVFFTTGFAQKNSVPCCSVIAVKPGQPCCAMVTIRDNATGRTFEISVDKSLAKNYTTGTALNAQPSAGIIKYVNGTIIKYAFSEPVISGSPCCGIISIEPGAPCCNIISVKKTELHEPPDGDRISFSVPKSFAANLEIGQKVSLFNFIPVDEDKFQPVDGYAVIQSKSGALSGLKMATYSFRLLPQSDSSINTNNSGSGWDLGTKKAEKQEVNNSINNKQWVITQNLLAKGATGRLFLNLPTDAECVITISQPVTEKQVFYSIHEHSFSFVPGTYDIQISGSKVKDVPVQKGMDTRVKAGILNVVASGIWTLYDEKRERQVYYSNTAKKIVLPVGTYQLEITGTMQQVIIKDGETVDF